MNSFRGLLLGSTRCFAPEGAESGGGASPAQGGGDGDGGNAGAADPAGQGQPGDGGQPNGGDQDNGQSDDKPAPTLLDALKKAEAPKDPASDPANSDPNKPDPKRKDGDDPAQAKDPAAEREAQDRELNKNPRFREIVAERDGFKKDAEQYRTITRYMDEQGLSHDEVADAIELSALLKNDPEAARSVVQKIAEALDGTLGNTLPEDLKAKVDSGEITEEAALEVSRARAKTSRAEQRTNALTETMKKSDETAAQTQLKQQIIKDVGTWETDMAKRDPDFAKIKPLVGVMVRNILFARGKGYESAADAVEVVKKAYGMAQNEVKRLAPAGQQRRGHHQSGGGGRGNQPASEPKSLKEAMGAALG